MQNILISIQKLLSENLPLILYSITTILLFADQNLLAPNLSTIANEFGFDNIERDMKLGGDISIAFFLLGAPASYVVGCLGDVYPRTPLFVLMMFIGESACAATYWTRSYQGLYICRAFTGFSMGGAIPLIYSLLGDLYPAGQRNGVSALVSTGMGIGIALGQGIAGYLGPTFGWRLPFLVVSIPALVTASLVGVYISEPKRGGNERAMLNRNSSDSSINSHNDEHVYINANSTQSNFDRSINENANNDNYMEEDQVTYIVTTEDQTNQNRTRSKSKNNTATKNTMDCSMSLRSTFDLLRTKTVFLLVAQGIPGCVPWGIVNVYLSDYLSNNQGMSVEGATTTILVFGFGVFLGMVTSGILGNFLYAISPIYPPLLAGSTAILGCIPFWILLNIESSTTPHVIVFFISSLAGLFLGVSGPIVKATLTNVTGPQQRGQAFALLNTFNDLGVGLGPLFVAYTIRMFDGNRIKAFNLGVWAWVACGLINILIYFTVVKDEEKVQNQVLENFYSLRKEDGVHKVHDKSVTEYNHGTVV